MLKVSDFWANLWQQPSGRRPVIGLADATDPRILRSLSDLSSLVEVRLIGDEDRIMRSAKIASVEIREASILGLPSNERPEAAALLLEKDRKKTHTLQTLESELEDPLMQSIVHLWKGRVDAVVAGASRPTADVVRAMLQFVGARAASKVVSGQFLLEGESMQCAEGGPFLIADCAVVPEPSSRSLAAIAQSAAESFTFFTGKTPRIAFLSFSTRGSASHPLVDRVLEAVSILRKKAPELAVDGELQVDAALDPEVAAIKGAADSPVAGRANVLIFPTLESGNIAYKLVQRFSSVRIAGPLLWGLAKPVSDLSRGCTVREIQDTVLAVARMVSMEREWASGI